MILARYAIGAVCLAIGMVVLFSAKANAAHDLRIVAEGSGSNVAWDGVSRSFTAVGDDAVLPIDALVSELANGDVVVHTGVTGGQSGDLRVEAGVNWSADTLLTLHAARDIHIEADLVAAGDAAGVALLPGQEGDGRHRISNGARLTLQGNAASLSIGGEEYALIRSLDALQAMADGLSGHYALGADLDAGPTAGWNCDGEDCAGFAPIGTGAFFSGRFDGLGHSIDALTIRTASPQFGTAFVGLFGRTNADAVIRHVTLTGVSVVLADIAGWEGYVGALAGWNWGGRIEDCRAEGEVTVSGGGTNYVGGLVGYNEDGIVADSRAAVTVGAADGDSYNRAGGLVGVNEGLITRGRASGAASAHGDSDNAAGGLVGENGGVIELSLAAGNAEVAGVARYSRAGGLVGQHYAGTIRRSHASGNATATETGPDPYDNYTEVDAGGLVGSNDALIEQSYATGDATASGWNDNCAGGLAGRSRYGSSILQSYALGAAQATGGEYHDAGGLIGFRDNATVEDSFWNTEANEAGVGTTQGGATGVLGEALTELRRLDTYAAWGGDISALGGESRVWRIYDGYTTPLLRELLAPLSVTLNASAQRIYNGATTGPVAAEHYSLSDPAASPAGQLSAITADSAVGGYDTASGTLTLGGLWSGQQGHDIVYAGSLDIVARPLTVVADARGKTVGDPDPELTWSAPDLIGSDTLTGSPSRAPGETPGLYAIGPGTLASPDYVIDFVSADFTILATGGGGVPDAEVSGGSWRFERSVFVPASGHPDSPPGPPPGIEFPHGLYAFTLVGGEVGSGASVVVQFPGPLPPETQYWKYGATADDDAPHWYVFTDAHIDHASGTVTLPVVDGGQGDGDLDANGSIVDPGGPGVLSADGHALPIPLLPPVPLLALTLMLALLAGRRSRA